MIASLSGIGRADSGYCESISYGGAAVNLWIGESYYWLPRRTDSLISLRIRYRDLQPAKAERGDKSEFDDPLWSIDTTEATALIQITRIVLEWPSTTKELLSQSPSGATVASDLDGWAKFVPCSTNCSSRMYVSEDWRSRGLDNLECREVDGANAKNLRCVARDHIGGLQLEYYFPAAKKAYFAEFRAKIETFVQKLVTEGQERCGVAQ